MNQKNILKGKHLSYWLDTTRSTNYDKLKGTKNFDVTIVGGGLAGMLTAFLLDEFGLKVAVVEAERICEGVTANTTAKISALQRTIYQDLVSKFGKDGARTYAEANLEGLNLIRGIVLSKHINCDFLNQDCYLYCKTPQGLQTLKKEYDSMRSIGLDVSYLANLKMPFRVKGAIRLPDQAQFHPRKFVLALARLISKRSVIFENSRVTDIEKNNGYAIRTEEGKIRSRYLVIASHFPIYDRPGMYFARLYSSRSYAVALKTSDRFPDGMYIGVEDDSYTFRSQIDRRGRLIIIGGGSHKTGSISDTTRFYEALEDFVDDNFSRKEILYRWSTQDNITTDHLPYIGRLTKNDRDVFVATGFAKWGMTNSAVSAMIISDLILGKRNPWIKLFDPSRFNLAGAKELLKQNADTLSKFIDGHINIIPGKEFYLNREEAKVVDIDRQKIAAYKTGNKVYALDAACVHMGCTVRWNEAEKSWDCPCHGSRYNFDGKLLHCPAVKGLKEKDDPKNKKAIQMFLQHIKKK